MAERGSGPCHAPWASAGYCVRALFDARTTIGHEDVPVAVFEELQGTDMDAASWIAIIVAVLGSGWIGATIGSWLSARQTFNTELRSARMKVYPSFWARTSTLSRSPRTTADAEDLKQLQQDLRRWYYVDGGIYLSRSSAQRYVELQEAMDAALVGLY
jgi:hypothetical protein